MDSDGDYVVIWQSYGSSDGDTSLASIHGQRFTAEGATPTPTPSSTGTPSPTPTNTPTLIPTMTSSPTPGPSSTPTATATSPAEGDWFVYLPAAVND